MAPCVYAAGTYSVPRLPIRPPPGTAALPHTRSRTLEPSALPWYPRDANSPVVVGEGGGWSGRNEHGTLSAAHDVQSSQDHIAGLQILFVNDAAAVPTAEQLAAATSTADECSQQPCPSSLPEPQLSVAAVSSLQLASHPIASTSQPACPSSVAAYSDRYSERYNTRCNSVTVKTETSVKDAAGAIVKVLDRMFTLFMTALRSNGSHESLNRAVKSLAVARKYIGDVHDGWELSFLPLLRTTGLSASNCEPEANAAATPDNSLFAFLVFKTIVSEPLKRSDETDLNVSRSSDANKMANAIISIVLDRGQAVMKAGGADALFVAMSAVINARHRLQRKYGFDLMMIPAWITEDTTSALGRESKFLRFNILKCPMNGPMEHTVRPVLA